MTKLIRLEEATLFTISVLCLVYLDVAWWCYLLLLLGPDISMLGYLVGNRVGAVSYNLFHHKGVAAVLFTLGFCLQDDKLFVAGFILFGHSSMDRMFGYGLKYFAGFGHTHLGLIGKEKITAKEKSA